MLTMTPAAPSVVVTVVWLSVGSPASSDAVKPIDNASMVDWLDELKKSAPACVSSTSWCTVSIVKCPPSELAGVTLMMLPSVSPLTV